MHHLSISGLVNGLAKVFTTLVLLLLVACSSDDKAARVLAVPSGDEAHMLQSDGKVNRKVASQVNTQELDAYGENIYHVLLAETYFQQKDYQQSSQLYSQLLAASARDVQDNPDQISQEQGNIGIARRATELAIKSGDYEQALTAAKRWKALQPDADEVNQYLVLLYQQHKDYVASAKILSQLVKATFAASKEVSATSVQSLDVAVALLERQADMEAAYYTLKQYLQQSADRQSDNASYYLALFAMRAGLYEEVISASQSFAQVKDKELQNKIALLRVKAYSVLDKPEQALQELKRLIAEAADPETQQDYARIMASMGKVDAAVALLGQVYEKHPDHVELLLDMIAINMRDKRYEQSLPLVEKLQSVKGQGFNAHYFRGLIFEEQKKYVAALREYRAIDADSDDMKIPLRITNVLQEKEGLESALAYLQQRLQHTEDNKKGNKLKSEIYLLESELLRKDGRYEEALDSNRKAEQLFPNDLDIIYSQALLYEDVEQIQKSEEKLLQILTIDSNHPAALNALGYILSVHTSRFDEAYGYIKKAYELKPDDPAIIDSLGWVAYRKGDLQDAERYLRLAYQKLQDPEVASHLVEVLAKKGEQDEATRVLNEMLKKHPDSKLLKKMQAIIKK